MKQPPPSPIKKRFTLIEVGVVITLAVLFLILALPVIKEKADTVKQKDVTAVQDAVRRYHSDTSVYPTFAIVAVPGKEATGGWVAGHLPTETSVPNQAGINFTAKAKNGDRDVAFVPDYLPAEPRYAGDVAVDGTTRWRINADGGVTIQLDGRSY